MSSEDLILFLVLDAVLVGNAIVATLSTHPYVLECV